MLKIISSIQYYFLVDIDECNAGTANCHSQATCTNTPGGFICACMKGYFGDGIVCGK